MGIGHGREVPRHVARAFIAAGGAMLSDPSRPGR
jgi:hypothetical protein